MASLGDVGDALRSAADKAAAAAAQSVAAEELAEDAAGLIKRASAALSPH